MVSPASLLPLRLVDTTPPHLRSRGGHPRCLSSGRLGRQLGTVVLREAVLIATFRGAPLHLPVGSSSGKPLGVPAVVLLGRGPSALAGERLGSPPEDAALGRRGQLRF